jgi:hypothetical protein
MNGLRSTLSGRFGRLAALVLLAGLLLRGFVPAGFMPDWHEAAQGVMTLTICTASGADRFIKVDAQGNPVADHVGGGEVHYGCGFVPAAGLAPLLLALVLLLPMVWRRRIGWTLESAVNPVRSDISAAHGARAPPAFA